MVLKITPKQRTKIIALVRRTCCNCCKGNCLLLDDGEYTLRRAIRSGQLPCRIVGRTYLISWQNPLKWVNCVDSNDNPL